MESINAARRTEDIALDLLKFVARTGQCREQGRRFHRLWRYRSAKPEDQVTQLLELYARCRQAVEAPVTGRKK